MCQINFYSRDCQIKFLLVMEVTLANYNNYKQVTCLSEFQFASLNFGIMRKVKYTNRKQAKRDEKRRRIE